MKRELGAARAFGFITLLLWAVLGLGLEAAHAFKTPLYLEDELTRMLLRLAHAHGALLGLLSLAYAAVGVPMFERAAETAHSIGRMLRAGSLLLPLGFALGALGHPEGDPGLGILLAPIGALLLLIALARLAVVAHGCRQGE